MTIKNQSATIKNIGGKASNLNKLRSLGFRVPSWFVIQDKNIPNESSSFNYLMIKNFGEDFQEKKYAVRSSASVEDGVQFSFAGMFDSLLNISFEKLHQAIKQVFNSISNPKAIEYLRQSNIGSEIKMSVIIQEMIEPEVSGVAFGVNPMTNKVNEKVISSVFGLGEGLVSGRLNADTYIISDKNIQKQIASKHQKIICTKQGTAVKNLETNHKDQSSLSDHFIKNISRHLDQLNKKLGCPQDIEFAISKGKLYLLQTRPITTIIESKERIVWDNSNIIESYPGISSPLTFSFIQKMYGGVYRQLMSLFGVSHKTILKHNHIFSNTLGHIKGRVYYNLRNWYRMLAMVPGYKLNARFMETMMGVKERFELEEEFKMSKSQALLKTTKMACKMVLIQFSLTKRRQNFTNKLRPILQEYEGLNLETLTTPEIIDLYFKYEKTVLTQWKAPLLNDFFAMVWFGLLKKQCDDLDIPNSNLHNDLLCGSNDIISVEPIRETLKIARQISQDKELVDLFQSEEEEIILEKLQNPKFESTNILINNYIKRFGERCVGELKLETISYAQDNRLYISILKNYVQNCITKFTSDSKIDEDLRSRAEQIVAEKLKTKFFKRNWFKLILKQSRDLVSNRENLRFERTKAFGVVRKIFTALGESLYKQNKIHHPRDIFYLRLEELKSLRTNLAIDLSSIIHTRKIEFENYRKAKDPNERFSTPGFDFQDKYIYQKTISKPLAKDLHGIGCCPGIIQGKVKIVKNANDVKSINGDILVTSSTDPGWVTLFPTCAAIIVERGSLLSHSAIVSREMGIPCIVSVNNLLGCLKTGDEIIMNGSTGSIEIINKK